MNNESTNDAAWQRVNLNLGLGAVILLGFITTVGGTVGFQSWLDSRLDGAFGTELRAIAERQEELEFKTRRLENRVKQLESVSERRYIRIENLLLRLQENPDGEG